MIKMPVLFIGHGSPMNAIEDNEYSKTWSEIAKKIPKPKAILCISAHWVTDETSITSSVYQKTIHDFGGFPEKLNKMEYPAKGDLELANKVSSLIKSVYTKLDDSWGLDHGSWSVLVHMYPKADIPVLQLSINEALFPEDHFEIGKELAKLREEGVLIIGLGNIVHNLEDIAFNASPQTYALEFDKFVSDAVLKKDYSSLMNYEDQDSSVDAVPTPEHYLPLLYVLGASVGEDAKIYLQKIEMGSISMTSFVFGDYNNV